MILADTSAWVEFDRATGSAVHQRVAELIAGDVDLAVTEPVIMEVLAGARNLQREPDLRRLLLRFPLLRFDTASDFDSAARIYRRCRAAGITPGGMVDCMIAAVTPRSGAACAGRGPGPRVPDHWHRLGPGVCAELSRGLLTHVGGAADNHAVLHTTLCHVS
jgi:predicted nucleic acid-binding protein